MSNPRELRAARRRVLEAQTSLDNILALPRRSGAQVVWSNGVVWTRVGDDQWLPWSENEPAEMPKTVYPSAHVASGAVVAHRSGDQESR